MSIYRTVEIKIHCCRSEYMCMLNLTFPTIFSTKFSSCVRDCLDLIVALDVAVKRNVSVLGQG
jgi:hypothetical protein